jgi:replicative DNA helicase
VSVAEFAGHRPSEPDEAFASSAYGARTPPQDNAAEQCVLGAMMLSKDAIADVVESLRGTDFYRPVHESVFDAVIDLYGRGEPADAVTVAAELQKRGELVRVGGAPYLHTLVASVPVAANAGYYAEIVREKAILRRLVDAGTKIVQIGYAGEGEVDDVVDQAQAEVYGVTDKRTSEDYAPLSEIMEATLDELDAISSRGAAMSGVPTGFADLDELTNGLHPGQMVIIAARPAIGKALALDTPLATPDGWTTMGQVQVGEHLIGADGWPVRVVSATEVMKGRECYEVFFADGSAIVADAQHQWATSTRASRRATSERQTHFYWSAESIKRVQDLATAASLSSDRPISVRDLVREVGSEFANTIRSVVSQLEMIARLPTTAVGPRRSYQWTTQAFSRRALLEGLAARISRPIGASQAAIHTEIKTTEEIARTLRCASADKRLNHAVRTCQPLQLPDAELDLPPYVLGVWLGDGHSLGACFTSADLEIPMRVEGEGILAASRGNMLYSLALPQAEVEPRDCLVCGRSFLPQTSQVRTCGGSCGGKLRFIAPPVGDPRCPDCGRRSSGLRRCQACHLDHGTVTGLLRRLGVLNDKHIPATYLRSSERQRRGLLAGLMDTDGTVTNMGGCQITLTNKRLITDVQELIVSLGYRCQMTTKRVPGRSELTSTAFTLNFTSPDDVFWLTRKATRHKELRPRAHRTTGQRMIADVRRVPSVAVRCVQVDAADNLYLAGEAMVPTHNSMISLDFARSASIRHGLASVIFSLEMGRTEITMRLLSAEARIPLNSMRNGKMTDDDWSRLARRMGEVSSAPLFIDDSPNMTMMEIRAKARRLKQRHDLRLLIVDYLQLMQSGKKVESRQLEVSEFSRQLKLLAKELDVPVVAVSQLNRGPEQRTDKRPMLSDLRESGCVTADTTLLRADTGAPITFEALMRDGCEGVSVWSLDEHRRMVAAPLTAVFASGIKETHGLTLASGRTVKASGNHRFLAYDGWARLDALAVGDRLAVPRRVPPPIAAVTRAAAYLAMTTDIPPNTNAADDVMWDRVVAVEALGPMPVYDATVKGTHNFIADGIIAHNSLEQDSDMVVLLHREDAYDRESTRPGEADLIVAKHRNGPTATLTVAFQGHYSRFVDMAPG